MTSGSHLHAVIVFACLLTLAFLEKSVPLIKLPEMQASVTHVHPFNCCYFHVNRNNPWYDLFFLSTEPLGMTSAVSGFVVGHFAVSSKLSKAHISFLSNEGRDNICITDAQEHYNGCRVDCKEAPLNAFTWLVKHFSHEGDMVVAINSINTLAAALTTGRDCINVANNDDSTREVIRCVLHSFSSSGEPGSDSYESD